MGSTLPAVCGVLFVVAVGHQGHAADTCADERDTITQEYAQHDVSLTPTCASYTKSARSEYFTHAELRVQNPHAWSLIRLPLTVSRSQNYGLDKWRHEYAASRDTNSVYRCPDHNAKIGGAKQSRHMFGDAADLRNVAKTEGEYNAMHAAATRANADYIEPLSGPCGLDCVHADWRDHAGPYTATGSLLSESGQTLLGSDVVKALDSTDQRIRIDAFYRVLNASGSAAARRGDAMRAVLSANPQLAESIRTTLIGTLAKENEIVRASSLQNRLSEEFLTYYGDLIAVVADFRDSRALDALLGAIETGAMASQGLAALGAVAVPRVIALLDDASAVRRQAATVTLGRLAATPDVRADQTSMTRIQEALTRAGQDADPEVRKAAETARALVPR